MSSYYDILEIDRNSEDIILNGHIDEKVCYIIQIDQMEMLKNSNK